MSAATVAFSAGTGRQAALLRSRRWRGPIEAAINAASLPRSTIALIRRAPPATAAEIDEFVGAGGDKLSGSPDGTRLGAAAAALAPTSTRVELAGERLTAWRVLFAAATGATLTLVDPDEPRAAETPPAPPAPPRPESFSMSAEVPGLRIEHLGLFFGKGGQNVRCILSQHRATLDVTPDAGDEDAAPSFAGRPRVTLTVSSRVSARKCKHALRDLKRHAEDCAVKYRAAEAWTPGGVPKFEEQHWTVNGYSSYWDPDAELPEPGTKAFKAAAAAGRCGAEDICPVHISPAGAIRPAIRVAPHAVHHFKAESPPHRLLPCATVTWPSVKAIKS